MKNLLKLLLVSFLLSVPMFAGENQWVPLLTGRNVVLTNAAGAITNAYDATSVAYYNLEAGTNVLSKTAYYMTNGVFGTNSYNYTFPAAWHDVKIITGRDGADVEQSIAVTITGNNAASTNTLTLDFAGVTGRTNVATLNSTWPLVFSVNGATPTTIITNLPSALRRGVGVRLVRAIISPAAGRTLMLCQIVRT